MVDITGREICVGDWVCWVQAGRSTGRSFILAGPVIKLNAKSVYAELGVIPTADDSTRFQVGDEYLVSYSQRVMVVNPLFDQMSKDEQDALKASQVVDLSKVSYDALLREMTKRDTVVNEFGRDLHNAAILREAIELTAARKAEGLTTHKC